MARSTSISALAVSIPVACRRITWASIGARSVGEGGIKCSRILIASRIGSPVSELELTLDRLYRELLTHGERAAKNHLPAVRDAWFGAAAIVAKEALAHGVKLSEPKRG